MADPQKIEIKIAATGGDQAAAEVRKVETASESLAEQQKQAAAASSSKGFGGMLDNVPERADAATKSLEGLTEAEKKVAAAAVPMSEHLGEATETVEERMDALLARAKALQEEYKNLGEETEKTGGKMRLGGAAMVGVAAGGAIVAKIFGEIADGLKSIDVEQLRELSPVMAQQVEDARKWSEILTDPINGIQRLISGNTVGEAFASVNDQLALNAEMQAAAMNRMITAGIRTADELKKASAEIAAANAILDAKSQADSKARDRTDAASIRDGAHPEDVAAKRAQDDAAAEIERINRALEQKAAEVNAAYAEIGQAKVNAANVERSGKATPEQLQAAQKQVADLEKRFNELQAQFKTDSTVAGEQRRGIREESAGKIEGLGADKRERIRDEQERLAKEGERAVQQAQREQEQQARKAEAVNRRGGADGITTAGLGRDAAREARERGLPRVASDLENKAKALMENPTAEGSADLMSLMERFVNWAEGQGGDKQDKARIESLEKKLATLEARQKNARR